MASTATESYPGMRPPPPGETVNLENPESVASRLILTCVLCPVLSIILVLLRWYTARVIVQKTHADDCE